jgi:hypothetical protein
MGKDGVSQDLARTAFDAAASSRVLVGSDVNIVTDVDSPARFQPGKAWRNSGGRSE